MRSSCSRRTRVLALMLGSALALPALGADFKPFPDDWFFDGAKRPAVLKNQEGKPATEITAESWIGDSLSIKEQRGKVVVIDFWATWCGPCMAAIPENVELVKELGSEGLVFVGVHDASSGWDQADGVVKDQHINYSVAHDKPAADGKGGVSAGAYQVQFWPTYVVIDRAGTVRGVGLTPNHVADAVRQLLAEPAPEMAAAGAEFGAEFFYGGEARPAALRALEGKPAPRIKAAKWAGEGLKDEAFKSSVVVAFFLSPESAVSAGELKKLGPLVKELSPQGVTFVAVSDGRAPMEKAEELIKAGAPAMALALDRMEPAKAGEAPAGVLAAPAKDAAPDRGATARAFGVRFAPATIVIDRAGKVRAAGVKADKLRAVVEKLLAEPIPAADAAGAGRGDQ